MNSKLKQAPNDITNILSLDNFFDMSEFSFSNLFSDSNLWQAFQAMHCFFKEYSFNPSYGYISPGAFIENPHLVFIDSDSVVESGAYIKGPCFIGKNTTIRHGAYIRGNVITGDNCVIGHCSEIKNSIFLNNAKAPHFNYVGDSIIGNRVNLGAGTICSNVRLDKKTIKIKINNQIIDTNMHKFGSIIGDNVNTGCNCVLNPGTFIYKNNNILPGKVYSNIITKFN